MARFLAVLLLFCLHHPSAFARSGEVEFLTLSAAAGIQRTSLLTLIEEFEEQKKLEVISLNRGVVYRRGRLHLLPDGARELQYLDTIKNVSRKSSGRHTIFQSARSTMILPPETPRGLIQLLRSKVNGFTKHPDFFAHWSDVKEGSADGGQLAKDGIGYMAFGPRSWNNDLNWHLHFRFTYKVRFEGKVFPVTTIPKDFGNLFRFIATLQRERGPNTVVLSTGGITPDVNADIKSTLVDLSKGGPMVIAAHQREIVGKKLLVDPYFQSWGGRPPISIVSINAYIRNVNEEQRLFPPYKIIEKNGLKIAVIGVTGLHYGDSIRKRSSSQPWLKNVIIKDPVPILKREIIPKVREEADLVILLSNLHEPDFGRIERKLKYVDIVARKHEPIFTSQGVRTVQFEDYRARFPQLPIFDIFSRHTSIARTRVRVSNGDINLRHSDIVQSPDLPTTQTEIMTAGDFSAFITGTNPILPDHHEIYGGDGVENISRAEFDRLAAHYLREATGAEVGIYASHELRSNVIGKVDAGVLKQWIRGSESLVSGYLTGAELTAIFNNNQKADEFNKLVFSGMPDTKRINTAPLRANDLYKVTLGSAAADNTLNHPVMAALKNKTYTFNREDGKFVTAAGGFRISLRDFYREVLKRSYDEMLMVRDEERIEYYKSIYEARPEKPRGFWAHDFQTIRLTYARVSSTDTSAFSNVSDSRLATDDQESIGGSIRYSAIYRKHPYITELGIRGDFSKTDITQSDNSIITNITSDDLVYFANIGFPWLKLQGIPKLATQAGPFFEVAFDTEFEKGAGQELEKKIDGILGFKFYDGSVVKNFTVGVINSSNRTVGQEKNEWGITSRLESNYSLLEGRATWRTEAEYQYFFPTDKDSNADLKFRATFDNYFDMKLWDKFSFGPYFKYFNFALKTSDEVGTQTEFGLSFNFSSLWKPKYQTSPL